MPRLNLDIELVYLRLTHAQDDRAGRGAPHERGRQAGELGGGQVSGHGPTQPARRGILG